MDGYTFDPVSSEMLAKLSIDPSAVSGFSLRGGIIRQGSHIWIGDNPPLHQRLLQATHSSALGGHSGFPVTYTQLKQLFSWRGMKSAVRNFVQTCVTCQQAKPDRARLPGLLQPLPVPVEGLAHSGNVNCILVIVDSFTKYGHFFAAIAPFYSFWGC